MAVVPSHEVLGGIAEPATPSAPQAWPLGELDATPVEEVVAERTATSEVWRNRDGTFTLRSFDSPRFFQAPGSPVWEPISTGVAPAEDGTGLRADAGPFTAEFRSIGPDGTGGVEVRSADGRTVAFAPLGASGAISPELIDEVGGEVVVYRDVWAGTDLEYRVTTSGVKEEVVVREHGPSAFAFAVRGQRLEADPSALGAFRAQGSGAAVRVASPVVIDADGRPAAAARPEQLVVSGDSVSDELATRDVAAPDEPTVETTTTTSPVEAPSPSTVPTGPSIPAADDIDLPVVPVDVAQVAIVDVDDEWLSAADLPVRVDPTITVGPDWTTVWSSVGTRCDNSCQVRSGNSTPPGQDLVWRSVTKFPYESLIDNHQTVLTAHVRATVASGDTYPKDVSLFWASDNSFNGSVGNGLIATASVATQGIWDVSAFYRSAVAADVRGAALGVAGEEYVGWYSYKQMAVALDIVYTRPPAVPAMTTPADQEIVVTTTPTLSASAVIDPDGDAVAYYFRVATGPDAESGQIVNSGWLSNPSWSIPSGSLHDGGTYFWHVYSSDGLAMQPAGTPRQFTVALRLGMDPVSPIDGLGGVAVNLATGNAVVSASTPTVAGLAGDVGVSFVYNSRQPRQNGLSGSYWWDGNANKLFDDGPVDLSRLDGTISFDWGSGQVAAGVGEDNVLVRWSGYVTVPSEGTWAFGAVNDDGVRIKIDGATVHEDWSSHAAQSSPSYGVWVAFPAGQLTRAITVEYYEATGGATVRLFTKNQDPLVNPGAEVPSGWLSVEPPSLPPRWTMSAGDATVTYLSARVGEAGVTVVLADGSSIEYKKTDGTQPGWLPPNGFDDVVTVTDGKATIQADDGRAYEFDADGQLVEVTSAVDDKAPSSYSYVWSGTPVRLQQITDPVSGQSVTLDYGGESCPTSPPAGLLVAPSGMLCKVTLWEGTATALWYSGSASTPFLARIEAYHGSTMPAVTDFVYGEFSKLTEVRSPLAADAVAAGVRSSGPATHTLVDYVDSGAHQYKVATITMPEPTPGQLRPRETYTYGTGTATVDVIGTAPTADRSVTWDSRWRMIAETEASGASVQVGYDTKDRITGRRELHTGLRTSTSYDHVGRPVAQYGPAPADWFFNGTGYQTEPVANASAVPTMRTAFDEATVATVGSSTQATGVYGLSAAYFSNSKLSGAPYKHRTALLGGNDGRVTRDWGTNGPDGVVADNWGVRLTGDITFTAAGQYSLYTISAGGTRIFIDDRFVTGDLTAEAPAGTTINNGVGTYTTSVANEVHRIRVEFADQSNNAALHLFWKPPAGLDEIVPSSRLAPRYGLPTTVVAAGLEVTTTTYSGTTHTNPNGGTFASGVRAEHGKPVTVTEGAGTANALQTSFTYENADTAGSLLRVTRKIQPAGTVTEYQHYAATQVSNGCLAGQKQAGRPFREKAPDPDGTGPDLGLYHDKLYDNAGRVLGTRTRSSAGNESWTCHTRDARGRVVRTVYPAFGDQAATRTVEVDYAPEEEPGIADPMVTLSWDSSGVVRSEVDLLGRVVSYSGVGAPATTFVYDQAGRLVSTVIPDVGVIGRGYDPVSNLPTTVSRDGQVLASVAYDPTTKRVSRVDYPAGVGNSGNGTFGTFEYDDRGAGSAVSWSGPGGVVASHAFTRTSSGRVVDESVDGLDPNPAGWNYAYEQGSKRVTSAVVPGEDVGSPSAPAAVSFSYSYGANPTGCTGSNILASAGRNSNRASGSVPNAARTGSDSFEYCYDRADRLVSSTDPVVGSVTYDGHGNVTSMFGETRGYDMVNRHVRTTKGATTVVYDRDVGDRIVARSVNGAVAQRYRYTGSGDVPSVVTNAAGVATQAVLGLPGGVSVTLPVGGGAQAWSYPNLHGDVMAVADGAGVKQGPTRTYDPFGNPVRGTTPDNLAGSFDWGWLGGAGRPVEHEGALQPTIEMGARQYSPRIGRFLEVDPIEGGSCNDYDYTCGDPLNALDLDGEFCLTGKNKNGSCRSMTRGIRRNAKAVGRWPVNAAGRVVGRVQGRSHRCGGGQKMRCVYNARFVPGGASAWTLGNTVYCRSQCNDMIEHEALHVRQFAQGGVAFPVLYVWEAAFGGNTCGNKYERSVYNAVGPDSC